MEELVVTRYWMAGVMAVMAVYGGIAVVGVLRNRSRNTKPDINSGNKE